MIYRILNIYYDVSSINSFQQRDDKARSRRFKRVGLEAGPLSQWLFSALAEAGLPAICVETRHIRAVLQAQINKTDRNDARSGRAGRFPAAVPW
jgi:transposase